MYHREKVLGTGNGRGICTGNGTGLLSWCDHISELRSQAQEPKKTLGVSAPNQDGIKYRFIIT